MFPGPAAARWWLGAFIAAAVIWAVAAVVTSRSMDTALHSELHQYGVQQWPEQEWPPFTAQELTVARQQMRGHPVKLGPGEEQAVIIRSIVTDKSGTYDCSALIGTCWAALIVMNGDVDPLEYHVVSTYGDNEGVFRICFHQGDRVIINWRAIEATDSTNIADLNWFRPIGRQCAA